jgi:hypothetical protein
MAANSFNRFPRRTRETALATTKQVNCLITLGVSPEEANALTRKQASARIDDLRRAAQPPSPRREVSHFLLDRCPDNLYVWLVAYQIEPVLQIRDMLASRLRVVIDRPTPRDNTQLPEHVPPVYRWYLRIRQPREGLASEAERCLRELLASPVPPSAPVKPPPRPESLPASDRRCALCNGWISAARVEAMPDCRLCVSCQEKSERAESGRQESVTDPGEQWFPRSECWRSKARGRWGR